MAKYKITVERLQTIEVAGHAPQQTWEVEAEVRGDERTAAAFLRGEAERLVPSRPTLRGPGSPMLGSRAPRIGAGGIIETDSGGPIVLPNPQP